MTDEELLTLAAKGAGYDIWWKEGTCKGGAFRAPFIQDAPWRPLEDDGDAFRLLMRLLQTQPFDVVGPATRRAIVEFAASVGKHHEN